MTLFPYPINLFYFGKIKILDINFVKNGLNTYLVICKKGSVSATVQFKAKTHVHYLAEYLKPGDNCQNLTKYIYYFIIFLFNIFKMSSNINRCQINIWL